MNTKKMGKNGCLLYIVYIDNQFENGSDDKNGHNTPREKHYHADTSTDLKIKLLYWFFRHNDNAACVRKHNFSVRH